MSQRTCTLEDLKRADANFFDLRHAESETVTMTVPAAAGGTIKKVSAIALEPDIRPHWLPDGSFRLPIVPAAPPALPEGRLLARFRDSGAPAAVASGSAVHFAFDPVETLRGLLRERYVGASRPAVSGLPFHYHRFPRSMRLWAHRLQVRRSAVEDEGFPAWPVEPSAEALRRLLRAGFEAAAGKPLPSHGSLWPGGKRFAVVLSHDMDTAKSFAAMDNLAKMEEARGLRSCWNVVGAFYRHDHAALGAISSAGHEIALHGYNHDNKLAYLPGAEIEKRLDSCAGFANRYGVQGFRSPSLLTSAALDAAVARRFVWSSSTIDTDVNSIIAPHRGVCSVFPFFKDGLLELPLTIPLDDRLMIMGFRGDAFFELVMKKTDWIAKVGGVVFLGNHPEPHISGNAEMLAMYERLLDALAARGDAWFALPSELARHWRDTLNVPWRQESL
ncbi:MAG: hypothetical protein ABIH66_09155 [bacterium]